MAKHNRAAFSKDDVPDAKLGHPGFDLRDYAVCRGLEFLDRERAAGFRAARPCDETLQSNIIRGVLPGGEHGVIANEGLEIGYTGESPDWGGTYYGTRMIATGGDFGGILGFVPIANWFVGSSATATVRVPCSVAAVRVPETVGTLTHLRFDRRRSAPPFSFGNRTKLGELVGANGWELYSGEKLDPEVLARLVAEPVAGLLRAHTGDGLFQAVVWWGTLVVRRNGFLRSPEELDELGEAASLLAARLRQVCLPLSEPQRFDTALSPPPYRGRLIDAPPGFVLEDYWSGWREETGGRYGLESEDPLAYHRAFPWLPVPGIACVVFRGTIPKLGVPGRLVVHRERQWASPAVVIPAPVGAEPTPPGGLRFREHGVRLEIADGLLAVWSTNSYWGNAMAGDLDAFCASVAAVLDSHGITPKAS